jgi:hypothetical protein
MPLFGWSVAAQFPYLQALWNQESGWNQYAENPSSGAYGIPQSLPASKMASAGADWRTNPATQERWGMGYIHGRYLTPAGAWAHERQFNWYDGGWMMPGMNLGMNGTGQPEPVFSPSQWGTLERAVQAGMSATTNYTANFTMPDSVFESRVQNAFRSMDMQAASRERVGRRQ